MLENFLDDDTKNKVSALLFQIKCYLLLIVILLSIIIYNTR